MAAPVKRDLLGALLVAALAAITWLPRLVGPIDLRWDAAAYYELGTALVQGKGLRLLHEPGEIQTTLHAPGVPVVVALHQLVAGTSDIVVVGGWLRYSYFVAFVAYAVAAYFLLRAFLPTAYAGAAIAIVILQLHTIFVSDLCFAEIPFALVTVLFTLCLVPGGDAARRCLSVPLAVMAFALRTVGVALLAAWVLDSLCHRRHRQAVWRGVVAATLVAVWAGYIASVEAGEEYHDPAYEYQRADYAYINVSYARNMRYIDPSRPVLGYASATRRVTSWLATIKQMPMRLGETVSTQRSVWDLLRTSINARAGYSLLPPSVVPLTLLLLGGLIVIGLGRQLAAQQFFIPCYVVLFIALVAATPVPGQYNRYLSPLGPFLALSLFTAMRTVARPLARLVPARPAVLPLALGATLGLWIAAAQLYTLRRLYTDWHDPVISSSAAGQPIEHRLFFYDGLYRATDAGLDWLTNHAEEGDIVAATIPPWAYLRTGLKSVLPPLEIDPHEAQRLLETVPVTFLMVDDGEFRPYTTGVVARFPERWRRVYWSAVEQGEREGNVEIYQRVEPNNR